MAIRSTLRHRQASGRARQADTSTARRRPRGIFGSALAAVGILAFFVESSFLTILVFGSNRVGPRMHFFATSMVALGSILSSIWIVAANSCTPDSNREGTRAGVHKRLLCWNPDGARRPIAMNDVRSAPTCFISYSWDSPEHRDWVAQLASKLRANGVDAALDAWHAPLGGDLAAFMGHLATCDFVLLICTPEFRAKSARGVAGGVGYEQAIITGQIVTGSAKPEKFIPLLRSGSAAESLPDYLLSRHWADFRDDARFEESFASLLRALFASPRHAIPPIGPRPSFAQGSATVSYQLRYFEAFDLDEDDPVASPRYAGIWTIGEDGPWRGGIREGVYRLANSSDPSAVRYGYVGLGDGVGALDDLTDARVSVDVRVGERDSCPFTSAGLMFRFDRERRLYTGLVLTRQVRGRESRGQLQLVTRNDRGFGLMPLGSPSRFDASRTVTLGIIGRGDVLSLFVNDEPFRSVPAPAGLRGDPGLLALGTGEFEFDNFTIASPFRG